MVYYNRNYNGRRNVANNWRRNRNTTYRRKADRPKARRTPAPATRRRINRSSTIGSFMRTAASSIISAIPGSSILKSVADFVFKAVKIKGSTEIDGFTAETEAIIGLNQLLVLKRVHFIINSPKIKVFPGNPKAPNEVERVKHIRDQYIAYNMKEVTIELKPQNDVGYRQGQWAMVFIPFISEEQANSLRVDYEKSYVGYNDIIRIEGSVSGPQTQSLKITYSPQAHDGMAFWAGESNDDYGMLLMSYQDFAKPTASEFTPQDFAATLLLNATVRKLNRRARVYTLIPVTYESLLSEVEEFVYDGSRVYITTSNVVQATKGIKKLVIKDTGIG